MKYVIIGKRIVGRVIYDTRNFLWVIKNNRGVQLAVCSKKEISTEVRKCWKESLQKQSKESLMIVSEDRDIISKQGENK